MVETTDPLTSQKFRDGIPPVSIESSNVPNASENNLQIDVWGDAATKAAAPGATVLIVDMREYGRAFFALLPAASTATNAVVVAWSHDGVAANVHSSAALIAAATGNIGADLVIHDNYAHITITQAVAAEDIYAYISGREVA